MSDIRRRLEEGGSILIFQTAFLGDVILTTGLLRATRAAFPRARIGAVTLPFGAELVAGWVDDCFAIDKRSSDAPRAWKRLAEELRSLNPAVALVPHRSIRTARFLSSLEIPCRIGFDRGFGSYFHTRRTPYPSYEYEGRRNLSLLKALTPTLDTGVPELRLTVEQIAATEKLISEKALAARSFAVFAPGSVWATKKWLAGHFRELRDRLVADYQLEIAAVGGEADRDLCATVASRADLNFAGELTPVGTASLMKRSKLVVAGDSAPTHLATAVGARQVIIFGSTSPRLGFAPPVASARCFGLDLWCRPCTTHGRRKCPWGSPRCLEDLSPAEIIKGTSDWLTGD